MKRLKKAFIIWLVLASVIAGVALYYETEKDAPAPIKAETPIKTEVPKTAKVESKNDTPKNNTSENDPLTSHHYDNVLPERARPPLYSYHGEHVYHVSEINPGLVNRTIPIYAEITFVDFDQHKNTLYYGIKDVSNGTEMKGVMFAKTINDNPERKNLIIEASRTGENIYLYGNVSDYNGTLGIKTWKVFRKEEVRD